MLEWLLTGGWLPPILMASGLFFLIYLKGYPFRAPRRLLQALRGTGEGGGVSPFRALMQALAGTLGVGNLVGVASAIRLGGAGAVFWMWMSALLAMILKYAEILLAVRHRRERREGGYCGGAVYYIKESFAARRHARVGSVIAVIFAALMLADAFSMGCVIQAGAIGSAVERVLHLSPWITGGVLVLLTLPLLWRGARGISALTEYLVPVMAGGYILLSLIVLFVKREALPSVLGAIVRDAFSVKSVGGGVLGFLTSRALKIGTMRGLLSNEAGCGTAPTAHAEAAARSPGAQGVWGIFEVFADTILLCTLSALVILVGGDVSLCGENDILLTITSYASVLGEWSGSFFAAAVFSFGYATLLCWGGYGLECVRFLLPGRGWRAVYILAFGACILLGAGEGSLLVWRVADFSIAAMTGINLCVLYLSRREIYAETASAFFPIRSDLRARSLRGKKEKQVARTGDKINKIAKFH